MSAESSKVEDPQSTPENEPPQGKTESDIWQTASARFAAYRRLNTQQTWANGAITLLSLFLILVALLKDYHLVSLTIYETRLFSAALITSSVFVAVISVLAGASNAAVRADRLHRSAMQLKAVERELRHLRSKTVEVHDHQFRNCFKQFDKILAEACDNHEPIDLMLFRSHHPKEFQMTWFERRAVRIRAWLKPRFLPIVSFALPVIALLALFF